MAKNGRDVGREDKMADGREQRRVDHLDTYSGTPYTSPHIPNQPIVSRTVEMMEVHPGHTYYGQKT
jgi:hypothetical protein